MMKTKVKLSKKTNKDIFTAKVALLQTTQEKIVRALADTELRSIGDESFVEGRILSPDPTHFDNGKGVLINIRHLITFTVFDSVEEVFKNRKMAELKAIRGGNGQNNQRDTDSAPADESGDLN